jgi:hypothetical protein
MARTKRCFAAVARLSAAEASRKPALPGSGHPASFGSARKPSRTNGRITDLGTLGGDQSSADAINAHSQIAGTVWLRNGHRHAVHWTLR